jgi:hypothetical protein
MEVHTHKHQPEHKKNWKEYIGEFFMLFLAVFSGFIAENLRENYTEREKGHQYITSMVSDLEKDTLLLKQTIAVNRKILKGIDSLLHYLKEPPTETAIKKIYLYGSYVGGSILFESENGTITQLKNAGGLRLIRDTASLNSISVYEQFDELTKKQGDAYYKSTLALLDIMEQIMDFSVVTHPTTGFYLSKDADKIRYFYNKCYIQNQIIGGYCTNLEGQKKEGARDIAILRKNYKTYRRYIQKRYSSFIKKIT